MTSADGPGQSHYQALFHCLEAASRFVAPTLSLAPAIQSLREIIPAMPSPSAMAVTDDGPPTTAQRTMELIAIAGDLLTLLDEASPANPLGWETLAGVRRIVEDLTGQLGPAVRQEKADLVRGLYVIIDPQVTGGRTPLEIAQAAIRGGARMLQRRDKLRDKGESLPLARSLQKLCLESGASLIVNDHADIAAIVGSAGLHVGQTDLPVDEARRVLSHHQVLGRSNHALEELVESEPMGAERHVVGAIYHNDTKGVGRPPQGISQLRLARETANTPLMAIGGINAETAAPVVEARADAICVTAAVSSATGPEAAAAKLVKIIEEAGGRV